MGFQANQSKAKTRISTTKDGVRGLQREEIAQAQVKKRVRLLSFRGVKPATELHSWGVEQSKEHGRHHHIPS